jgi:serine/threonine-protein kinase
MFSGSLGAKYEYRHAIGHGGMGTVVLARHRQLDELVAIKFLRAELLGTEFLSRFRREARTAIKIRSQHVARVLDVGVLEDETPYIVMEYLEGQDLAALVAARGRMRPDEAIDVVLQALDAIAEAHALGIVHRDLKPANLFITRGRDGPVVKVLDFGLAKRSGGADSVDFEVTQPGTLVGSPCYMPPEQLLDAKDADARSDVWALGATLFELITGVPPFQAPTMPQLYTKIVHGNIPRVRDLVGDTPAEVDDVVARCLRRPKCERFEHAGALRDALSQLASGRSPAVPTPDVEQSIPPVSLRTSRVTPITTSRSAVSEVPTSAALPRRSPLRPLLVAAAILVAGVVSLLRFAALDPVPSRSAPSTRSRGTVSPLAQTPQPALPPSVSTHAAQPALPPLVSAGAAATTSAVQGELDVRFTPRKPRPRSHALSAPVAPASSSAQLPAVGTPTIYDKYP